MTRSYDDRETPAWLLLPGINLALLFMLLHDVQTHGAIVSKLLSLLG